MNFNPPRRNKNAIDVYGLANGNKRMICSSATFEINGIRFEDDFTTALKEDILPKSDSRIIGIIGIDFLIANHLVMDYANRKIYTSFINHSNFSVADCNYFFNMDLGLKHYGMPVIPVKGKDYCHAAIVDSGADCCFITSKTVDKVSSKLQLSEWACESYGVAGKQLNRLATVGFSIQGWDSEHTETMNDYPHEDLFQIVEEEYIFKQDDTPETPDKDSIQPIDLIIGAPFLEREGWALDFGAQLIYKRKPVTA